MKARLCIRLAAASVVVAATLVPAHAALTAVGPVDPANGFPAWYQDSAGLRLAPCLAESPLCAAFLAGSIPDPNLPVSFPANFPDVFFYWSGDSVMTTGSGARAELKLGLEGGFVNGSPAPGEQITLSRVRVRVAGLVPGASYAVTHPFGVDTFFADTAGSINVTQNVGGDMAGDFATALTGRVGPFLIWDPAASPAAPAGFIGDPGVDHEVVGSPLGTNLFAIDGPDIGGPGVSHLQTNLFSVQGQIAGLAVFANPRGGLYNAPRSVTLTASDPAAAIHYTTDESEPTAASPTYAGPIAIATEGSTSLKFIGINGPETSPVGTELYTIDTTPPVVSMSPAGGSYNVDLSVVLSADEAATIHYTTDGSQPTTSSAVYSSPIVLTDDGRYTIKAMGVDGVGNRGQVLIQEYVIDRVAPHEPVYDPQPGIYLLGQDVSIFSASSDVYRIYYTTDGTDPRTSATRAAINNGQTAHLGCNVCTIRLRAVAQDLAGNYSPVKSGDYTILLNL